MDACPGRLNQVAVFINRAGTFYGQCSELCGINHSFMPICIDAVIPEQYSRWIDENSGGPIRRERPRALTEYPLWLRIIFATVSVLTWAN
jgi:heme/copper-type cytochrome/quinol oxidase subunit 2